MQIHHVEDSPVNLFVRPVNNMFSIKGLIMQFNKESDYRKPDSDFVVKGIAFQNSGFRISYEYEYGDKISKYFNHNNPFFVEYDADISKVSQSICVIPLVSNVIPIAWFAGFNIHVDEIDEDFFDSIEKLKIEFQRLYPSHTLKGNLYTKRKIKNKLLGHRNAQLFSGGVDAYATFFRHKSKDLMLLAIRGADILLNDADQWDDLVAVNEQQEALRASELSYMKTNLREFYTYHVEMLIGIGWWGKVQHGLAMLGAIAPYTFQSGISNVYIASSYTDSANMSWGSTPRADELISWAGCQVNHDGFELQRQEKVGLIVRNCKQSPIKLRVCYSEVTKHINCSACEKCYRTIMAIILEGDDPNKYGFSVDENIYGRIFEHFKAGGSSKGEQYFWSEIRDRAKGNNDYFVFHDKAIEGQFLLKIADGTLNKMQKNQKKWLIMKRKVKFLIGHSFPNITNIYRKLKRQSIKNLGR